VISQISETLTAKRMSATKL